jgi:DNA-binding transcriptional LysR family regulator
MNTASNPLAGLKMSHLRLMAALETAGQLGVAADRLGLAQPAASRLLAEVEQIVGHKVHQRDGRGLRLTEAGAIFARRAARMMLELQDAAREIGEVVLGDEGHVRIGSVTGPALNRVLPALGHARSHFPGITTEVIVNTSATLCDLVLAGRLDFALGRLNGPSHEQNLSITMMGDEPISLVVRRGHPLLTRARIAPPDAMEFDWVMPEDEALLTKTVLTRLRELGLPPPRRQLSTSSFLFTLAMLRDSNAIAPLAEPVVESFASGPSVPFVQLPLDMGLRVDPFGLIRRRDALFPPAANKLAALILQANAL